MYGLSEKSMKAKNNPKPTIDDACTYPGCNRRYSHLHEVFGGNGRRQISIRHGLQVRLCQEHHQGPLGPHLNREYDLELKRKAQAKFEGLHGREKFMRLFGRNYL